MECTSRTRCISEYYTDEKRFSIYAALGLARDLRLGLDSHAFEASLAEGQGQYRKETEEEATSEK